MKVEDLLAPGEQVLARIYSLPKETREYAQKGKTRVSLAVELGPKVQEISKTLTALQNKKLIQENANPFDADQPFFFRKVEE